MAAFIIFHLPAKRHRYPIRGGLLGRPPTSPSLLSHLSEPQVEGHPGGDSVGKLGNRELVLRSDFMVMLLYFPISYIQYPYIQYPYMDL